MNLNENYVRRKCVPVLYTTGTHYQVGFDMGRTFASMIQDFLEISVTLNQDFLPIFQTPDGQKAYEDTLETTRMNFPHYIRELEGIADGAKVSFQKLFLLHMDDVNYAVNKKNCKEAIGCTDVLVNCPEQGHQILGHTEDALAEMLNHVYFVSARITSEEPQGRWGVKEEHFTALCYAGHLPGYCMNANKHGLVFSINTLNARDLFPGRTPRHFLTRALLAASSLPEATDILRDSGVGAANGCSINLTFLEDADKTMYNIEIAPSQTDYETMLDIMPLKPNSHYYHCNSYLRVNVDEDFGSIGSENSNERMRTLLKCPQPKTKRDVINYLGDTSSTSHRIFQEFGKDDVIKTVLVGIFDCLNKTWSIYVENPAKSAPILTFPLTFNVET